MKSGSVHQGPEPEKASRWSLLFLHVYRLWASASCMISMTKGSGIDCRVWDRYSEVFQPSQDSEGEQLIKFVV